MIVVAATGVEGAFALRANILGIHISRDRQFDLANSAANSFFVSFLFRPNFGLVIRCFSVAFIARIIVAAAFEFDGDDIQF